MSQPVPARRSPTGFVAQRLYSEHPLITADRIERQWLLTSFSEAGGLQVEALTDEDVKDWPELN